MSYKPEDKSQSNQKGSYTPGTKPGTGPEKPSTGYNKGFDKTTNKPFDKDKHK